MKFNELIDFVESNLDSTIVLSNNLELSLRELLFICQHVTPLNSNINFDSITNEK